MKEGQFVGYLNEGAKENPPDAYYDYRCVYFSFLQVVLLASLVHAVNVNNESRKAYFNRGA